jgi:hypothetical protein
MRIQVRGRDEGRERLAEIYLLERPVASCNIMLHHIIHRKLLNKLIIV